MTDQPEILLSGWHAKATRALQGYGARVVCAVAPKDREAARARSAARDVVVVADPTSVEDILAALARAGEDPARFTVVSTMREFALTTMAALACVAGARGLSPAVAVALRDKFVQKRLVRAAGIRVADCWAVDSAEELRALPFSGPIVVKPLSGAGARDTHILPDLAARDALADRCIESPSAGAWLVEQFIAGEELHCDGVVRDGEVVFLGVSEYLQNVISIKDGGLVGSYGLRPWQHPKTYDELRRLTADSLEAIGLADGIFHLEVFRSGEEFVFSECAGRVGGGMIHEVVQRQFGVDLVDAWARALLGLPPLPVPEPDARVHGFVQFRAPAGRVSAAPTEAELLDRPGCAFAAVDLHPGDEVPDAAAASNHKAGKAMVEADDETELRERAVSLARWFHDAVVTTTDPEARP